MATTARSTTKPPTLQSGCFRDVNCLLPFSMRDILSHFPRASPQLKYHAFFYWFFFFFGIYLLFPWSVTFLVSTQHMNSVFTSKADGVVKDKGSVSLLRPFPTMFFWEGRGQEGAGRGSSQDQPQALCLGSLAQCRVRSTGGQEWEHPDPGEQDGNRGGFPTRCK